MFKLFNNQKGDTIVEVIIAIGIISVVLVASYSIANRSLATIRDAQEHTIALKIAEAQIEQLKVASQDPTLNKMYNRNAPFCVQYNNGTGKLEINNGPCAQTNGIPYNVSVSLPAGSGPDYTYTISVTWDTAIGSGQGNVSLVYRLYKPS